MAPKSLITDDAWLATADRYVAEAQAEWVATMAARPPRGGPPRDRQRGAAAAKTKSASHHAAIADGYIAQAEKRLARQATHIGRLAAGNHETNVADGQFWVMGQLLGAMRDRRQRLANDEK